MTSVCPICQTPVTNEIGGLCPDCVSRVSVCSIPVATGFDRSVQRSLGDYELLEEIAQGGMGIIFKARQKSLNRLVAVKLMRTGQFATQADLRRFRAEAEAAASLDHPNILPVYDVGETDGRAFFSMKLLPGGTLRALDQTALSEKSAAVLVAKIARAIQFAHDRGILHRDLKPENILLDERGEPHVTDFGLAKRLDQDAAFTVPGGLLGTPAYMAPEQARTESGSITTAADIYSIGAIFYFLLTRHAPFEAESAVATVRHVIDSEPLPPTRRNPAISRDLEAICLKCLEKDPAGRYRTASELADDVERWLRGETIIARHWTKAERLWKWARRHPVPATLLLLLITVGVIGSVAVFWQWRRANLAASSALAALEQARESLWKANLERARYVRLTPQAGRRSKALAAVREAAQIRPSAELRSEAITALSLMDLGAPEVFLAHPPGGERAQSSLFLPRLNRDLTIGAWPLSDGTILFRRLRDGAEVQRISSGAQEVLSLDWSKNDRYFAVGKAARVDIWDLAANNLLFSFEAETPGVPPKIAFSDDSARIAIAAGATLKIFNLADRKLIWERAHNAQVLALHPTNSWVAFRKESSVAVWNFRANQEIDTFALESPVVGMYWSPDSRVLLCAQADKDIYARDVISGDKNLFFGHLDRVENITLTPSGEIYASSTRRGHTRLWDTLGWFELGMTDEGSALRFSEDGVRLGFSRPDGVGVWPVLQTPPIYYRLTGRMDHELGQFMVFNADGRFMLSISDEVPGVWSWETASGKMGQEPLLPEERLVWMSLLDSGEVMSFGTEGIVIRSFHWDQTEPWASQKRVLVRGADLQSTRAATLSHNSSLLFYQSGARSGALIAVTNGQARTRFEFSNDLAGTAIAPDGTKIAVSLADAEGIQMLDLGGNVLQRLTAMPSALQFSPDNRWLAGFSSVECKVWNATDWTEAFRVSREQLDLVPGGMAFSPDGRFFFCLRTRHLCEMLETGSWRMVARFELPPGAGALKVRVSPRGEHLSLFGNAAIHLYHLPSLRRELASMGLDW